MLPCHPALSGMGRPVLAPALPQLTSGPPLHQYACLRCRSRRVKCDKLLSGCANCAGHDAQCVYSARRPRKPRRGLSESAAHEPSLPAPGAPILSTSAQTSHAPNTVVSSSLGGRASEPSDEDEEEDAIMPRELRDTAFRAKSDIANANGGTLLVGPQGSSRYFNNEKIKQVAYFETILSVDRTKNHESKLPTPWAVSTQRSDSLNPSSLLTISREQIDLNSCSPPAEIMHVLWDYYCCNVDTMSKCLYKPDVDAVVIRASRNMDSIDLTGEAPLLFAIWFSVATVMSPEEARLLHREDKVALIRKYRYGLEHALAQAGWMTTQNIHVLQSLAIYLVFCSYNSRSSWMLSGTALGLAQAMGMHSDSASFSLGVIDTEVRRRVWWLLAQLDVRISENCGLESHVPISTNTELPMHINDSDLAFTDGKSIKPRIEFTEMTLTLVKLEMGKTNLQRQRASNDTEKERILRDQVQRYEDVWLKYFNGDSELHRLCYLATRFLMVRLQAMAHAITSSKVHQDEHLDEEMLLNNARLLEISVQLPFKCRRYGWFFRCKHSQWHALAYLLIQMCKHTEGPAVDRAWEVIDATFLHLDVVGYIQNGNQKVIKTLWQPLFRLLERARSAREHVNDTPSTIGTLSEDQHPTLSGKKASLGDDLIADPFLSYTEDFSMEIDWKQIDEWVQKFQSGLQEQIPESQDMDMLGAMSWW